MPLASQLLGVGGVKSIQRGIISVTALTNQDTQVAIPTVNPAFTHMSFLGAFGYTGDGASSAVRPAAHGYVRLASDGASVIGRSVAYRYNSVDYPMALSWELLEYYPS